MNTLLQGDCLDILPTIKSESVDLILTDLPYSTSACKWDKLIPMDKLWPEYERIIKPKGAIVLFAQQPFTSYLISSNPDLWKYNWVWKKDNGTNFLNSHYQPLKVTEDICVFSKAPSSYTKNGGGYELFSSVIRGKAISHQERKQG